MRRIEMMQHEAPVYLAGFMVNDPKFKKVGDDVSSVKLRIAYTARWRNRETGEWADGATTFVNVQCWRQLADNVATCLRKGEPVLVMGRLRIRSYNDAEGKTRSLVEIEASSVGHDLTRGTAHFSRAYRPAGGRPAGALAGHSADGPDPDGPDPDGPDPDGPDLSAQPPGANGDAVVDEQAVADFARELSALGPDAVTGPETEPEADPAAAQQP
jgi:single-strand DNA-binding protein